MVRVGQWEEVKEFLRSLGKRWIFRGQRDERSPIESSLSPRWRTAGLARSTIDIERWMLAEFQRGAHLNKATIAGDPPGPANQSVNRLEWLALMQHFGAPTRLIDWTQSPYIGAYFAVEDADGPCAVWGLDQDWFHIEAGQRIQYQDAPLADMARVAELYVGLALDGTTSGLFPLDVSRSNERSLVQQGLFAIEGNAAESFEQNLRAYGNDAIPRVVKVVIPVVCRRDPLADLYSMNLHQGSLFPGLTGSRRVRHWLFDPNAITCR